MSGPSAAQRADLRGALRSTYPWLLETDVGPQAVVAGECGRCGRSPRLLPTCGPVAWQAICRDCAGELGTGAWCDGHRDDAVAALAWAAGLPDDWADIVRLWWIATGEVRLPHEEMGHFRAMRTVSPQDRPSGSSSMVDAGGDAEAHLDRVRVPVAPTEVRSMAWARTALRRAGRRVQ